MALSTALQLNVTVMCDTSGLFGAGGVNPVINSMQPTRIIEEINTIKIIANEKFFIFTCVD